MQLRTFSIKIGRFELSDTVCSTLDFKFHPRFKTSTIITCYDRKLHYRIPTPHFALNWRLKTVLRMSHLFLVQKDLWFKLATQTTEKSFISIIRRWIQPYNYTKKSEMLVLGWQSHFSVLFVFISIIIYTKISKKIDFLTSSEKHCRFRIVSANAE